MSGLARHIWHITNRVTLPAADDSVPIIKHALVLMVIQLFEVLIEVVGFPAYHLLKFWSTQEARVLLCNAGMHIKDLHNNDQAYS